MNGIRPARPADAEELGAVHAGTWRETYSELLPETVNRLTPERSAEIFRRRGCRDVLVSEKDGKIVGFCVFENSGGEGEIIGLYVLRSAQNEGRGTALLKAAEELLKERKVSLVRLWVAEGNERAIRFYRARGFAFSSEKRQAPVPEAEMIVRL